MTIDNLKKDNPKTNKRNKKDMTNIWEKIGSILLGILEVIGDVISEIDFGDIDFS